MYICLGWGRFNATLVGHSARTTQVVTCSNPDPRFCWSRSQFAAIVVLCCGCDVVNAVDVDADNRPLISVWCCGEMLHCCNHKWLAQHLPSTENSGHQNMEYLYISLNIYTAPNVHRIHWFVTSTILSMSNFRMWSWTMNTFVYFCWHRLWFVSFYRNEFCYL